MVVGGIIVVVVINIYWVFWHTGYHDTCFAHIISLNPLTPINTGMESTAQWSCYLWSTACKSKMRILISCHPFSQSYTEIVTSLLSCLYFYNPRPCTYCMLSPPSHEMRDSNAHTIPIVVRHFFSIYHLYQNELNLKLSLEHWASNTLVDG